MNRQKYYSTKIKRTENLRKLIAKKKLENITIRLGMDDYNWSRKIKHEMSVLKLTNGAIDTSQTVST